MFKSKKSGYRAPESVKPDFAVLFRVGWIVDHEIHRRLRERVHDGSDKGHRSVMHGTVGTRPLHQFSEASHRLVRHGAVRCRDLVGNAELREVALQT
jgi:hypothetical protein